MREDLVSQSGGKTSLKPSAPSLWVVGIDERRTRWPRVRAMCVKVGCTNSSEFNKQQRQAMEEL